MKKIIDARLLISTSRCISSDNGYGATPKNVIDANLLIPNNKRVVSNTKK